MLYLVAHLFLNGQLKKLNLFSVTRATREAIKKKKKKKKKKNLEPWGREWAKTDRNFLKLLRFQIKTDTCGREKTMLV